VATKGFLGQHTVVLTYTYKERLGIRLGGLRSGHRRYSRFIALTQRKVCPSLLPLRAFETLKPLRLDL